MYAITPHHLWMQRRVQLKERERNFPASLLSITVIATLSTALAQPRWFFLKGGGCSRTFIGVQDFFYMGYFETVTPIKNIDNRQGHSMTLIYYGYNDEMRNCVTPEIVNMQRVTIALCFLAIFSSLVQFFMDTIGVMQKWLKTARRNGLGSILTVLLCVSIIGCCFYTSTLMEQQQKMTKANPGTKVEVKFDISYFLVTGAGAVAIVAAAANLLRQFPVIEDQNSDALLDDMDHSETFSVGLPHAPTLWPYRREASRMQSVMNPPPYAP